MYFHFPATMGHLLLSLFKKSQLCFAVFVQVTVCGWILRRGGEKGRGAESEARMFHFTPSAFIYETSAWT